MLLEHTKIINDIVQKNSITAASFFLFSKLIQPKQGEENEYIKQKDVNSVLIFCSYQKENFDDHSAINQ